MLIVDPLLVKFSLIVGISFWPLIDDEFSVDKCPSEYKNASLFRLYKDFYGGVCRILVGEDFSTDNAIRLYSSLSCSSSLLFETLNTSASPLATSYRLYDLRTSSSSSFIWSPIASHSLSRANLLALSSVRTLCSSSTSLHLSSFSPSTRPLYSIKWSLSAVMRPSSSCCYRITSSSSHTALVFRRWYKSWFEWSFRYWMSSDPRKPINFYKIFCDACWLVVPW